MTEESTDDPIEKITEEQRNIFRQKFDSFDEKRDGQIATSDLGNVLRACGQIPTEGWLNERVKAADPEEKGFVDWEGFQRILNQCMMDGNPDEDLLEAFRRFDKAHTGIIANSQLREIMLTMGDVLTEEELDEMLRDADPLERGEVNYENFARQLINGPD